MKLYLAFETCLLLGLAVALIAPCLPALAGEPLPDATMLARGPSRPKQPAPPVVSDVTLTGTINVATMNGLKIKASKTSKTTNQKQWLVFSKADVTDVTIHAIATLDYVKKGQIVEFHGRLVNNEKLADKLKEFTIVARKSGKIKKNDLAKVDPAKDHPPAGGAAPAKAKADDDAEPTIGLPEDSGTTDSSTVVAKDPLPGAKSDVVGPKTRIFGKIATFDSKTLTVTVGERTIHADLAEIPTINVEISEPQVIAETKDSKIRIEGPGANGHLVSLKADDLVGAKIVVHGTASETKTLARCSAKDMDITLSRPLTGKKPSTTTEPPKKALADDTESAKKASADEAETPKKASADEAETPKKASPDDK
jgi:fructose-specific phosphotransferase system component IIB